jgi:tetratricopeptide (TPR) repeat protein
MVPRPFYPSIRLLLHAAGLAALLACASSLGPVSVWAQTTSAPEAPKTVGQAESEPPVDSALRIQELQDSIARDPSDAEAHTKLGILFVEEGLFADARNSFISALQAAPAEPSSHLNLGLVLLRMERWDEARIPLQTFLAMTPGEAQGHVLLGRSWEGAEDLERARAVWLEGVDGAGMPMAERVALLNEVRRTVIDEREPTADELRDLAETLEARPEILASEAGAELRHTVSYAWLEIARRAEEGGDEKTALDAWTRARDSGTDEDAAWTQPAEIQLEAGRLSEARALVDDARSRRPESALIDYLDGRIAEKEGDLPRAALAYRNAAARDESFPGVHAALGGVLAQLGDAGGAADALAKAVGKGEGGAAASYNMGVVLSKKEQFRDAIPHLEKAVQLDPSLKDAYRALGTAYRKTDQFSKSSRAYQQVIDRFGPDPSDLYQLAYAQAKIDDHRAAAENYSMVVALQPENRLAHYNLGNSLLKLQRFAQAAEQFQAAIDLKNDFHAARYNLALSFQKMGEYERAIEAYELALDIKESYAIYVNMAICYKELGDEETSDEYYKLANELRGGR